MEALVSDPASETGVALSAAIVGSAFPAVSALKYGDPEDSTTDQTAAVQQVIDEVAAAGGGVISWPARLIVADIILRTNVRIIGQGFGRSVIKAPAGSTRKGIVTIDQSGGPVRRVYLSDVSISGNGNPNQWGIFFKGVAGSIAPFDGGLWYSDFERLRISNTLPGGILMQGGPVSSLLPQQFLNFRSVHIQLTSGTYPNWVGIRIAGQVGQVHFDQVEASYRGTNFELGTNYGAAGLYVSREIDDSGAIISDRYPYALKFTTCTFQGCVVGARLDRVQGCTLESPWFEDNQSGILFEQSCSSCSVVDGTFADSGSNGAGTGYIAQATGTAYGEIDNPTVLGAYDRTWVNSTGQGHLRVWNAGNGSASIANFPKQFAAAGTLVTARERYISITGATTVTSFTSYLDPDEVLYVRLLSDVTINGSSGNIRFPTGVNNTTLTFRAGARLAFKFDKNGNLFTLMSMSDRVLVNAAFRIEGDSGNGYFDYRSQSADPAAPTSGYARLFMRTNGSGKGELCVRFATGAVQVLATEP
ncbi:hypothetical protein JNB62_05310 [Microbacterium jejuense]|uniref:Pectate lyase superfamily protein n=1 Tax=Microbacterium jejuense TaxID=1263637 RepID=A0ABS7HJV1_9MICO|nr:glycoside hydrolase family 55 protein [Microbacterium jejuense]MBW9093093.1 hypothetical protein [Microbacterium jejuense]